MKILFIAETRYFTDMLKALIDRTNLKHEYDFDYINKTTHLDDNTIRLRKRDGKIYQGTKEQNFINLKLNKIEIPNDTFLEYGINVNKKENINYEDYDEIISICDYDEYGILGFQKYIEKNNLKYCNIINVTSFELKFLFSILDLENVKVFENILLETIKDIQERNFIAPYPRKHDILKLMKKSNMTKEKFSDYFNISCKTIEKWECDDEFCPPHLYDLMEHKLKNENLI